MIINNNSSALNSNNSLDNSRNRMNPASDDAAGLAISMKMRENISGIESTIKNCDDVINMVQIFGGALNETANNLSRMKELTNSAANSDCDNDYRFAMQKEFDNLNAEINYIADTSYNTVYILNGGVLSNGSACKNFKDSIVLEVNLESKHTETLTYKYEISSIDNLVPDMNCTSTGLGTKNLSILDEASAKQAVKRIELARNKVTMITKMFNAIENRVVNTAKNLDSLSQIIYAAESSITDAMFYETIQGITNGKKLEEIAAVKALSQTNKLPQSVLQLLR